MLTACLMLILYLHVLVAAAGDMVMTAAALLAATASCVCCE